MKLKSARYTWLMRVLRTGKSVQSVADQLGDANPALALRVYAHVIRAEESDLFFADNVRSATVRVQLTGYITVKRRCSNHSLRGGFC